MSDFEFMAHHKKLIVNDTFVHFFQSDICILHAQLNQKRLYIHVAKDLPLH